ncbi:MAG: radical SAM protein [Endomicrobiales bacterium]|nr:radical SAM protein [Endomicrobiales bacterium]
MNYKYLFGPVPSRRLGRSLGVDLVPHKTCSFNCIFCECGETTDLTIKKCEYVPTEKVLKELDDYLSKKPKLDYITFSGSGEPTLHLKLGKIVRYIKSKYSGYKIALLTNGSLFCRHEVRGEVGNIDVIIPTLNTVNYETFNKICRPHKNLDLTNIINGLVNLRKDFPGQIWLEVFIIPGVNDTEEELSGLKEQITKIQPDKIQINSLHRPGAKDWVKPASSQVLKKIAEFFGDKAEVISNNNKLTGGGKYTDDIEKTILKTIQRRPCTAKDLSVSTGYPIEKINKSINGLVEKEKIKTRQIHRRTFYMLEK